MLSKEGKAFHHSVFDRCGQTQHQKDHRQQADHRQGYRQRDVFVLYGGPHGLYGIFPVLGKKRLKAFGSLGCGIPHLFANLGEGLALLCLLALFLTPLLFRAFRLGRRLLSAVTVLVAVALLEAVTLEVLPLLGLLCLPLLLCLRTGTFLPVFQPCAAILTKSHIFSSSFPQRDTFARTVFAAPVEHLFYTATSYQFYI